MWCGFIGYIAKKIKKTYHVDIILNVLTRKLQKLMKHYLCPRNSTSKSSTCYIQSHVTQRKFRDIAVDILTDDF